MAATGGEQERQGDHFGSESLVDPNHVQGRIRRTKERKGRISGFNFCSVLLRLSSCEEGPGRAPYSPFLPWSTNWESSIFHLVYFPPVISDFKL